MIERSQHKWLRRCIIYSVSFLANGHGCAIGREYFHRPVLEIAVAFGSGSGNGLLLAEGTNAPEQLCGAEPLTLRFLYCRVPPAVPLARACVTAPVPSDVSDEVFVAPLLFVQSLQLFRRQRHMSHCPSWRDWQAKNLAELTEIGAPEEPKRGLGCKIKLAKLFRTNSDMRVASFCAIRASQWLGHFPSKMRIRAMLCRNRATS